MRLPNLRGFLGFHQRGDLYLDLCVFSEHEFQEYAQIRPKIALISSIEVLESRHNLHIALDFPIFSRSRWMTNKWLPRLAVSFSVCIRDGKQLAPCRPNKGVYLAGPVSESRPLIFSASIGIKIEPFPVLTSHMDRTVVVKE